MNARTRRIKIQQLSRLIESLDGKVREAQRNRQPEAELQRALAKAKKEKLELQDSLLVTASQGTVTDHAVLRYLERKYSLDIASLKQEMFSPVVKSALEAGASSVVSEGMKFVFVEKVLVSVYPA